MAKILKGAPVAEAVNRQVKKRAEALKEKGITPTLAIIRIGEEPGQLSYERGIMKKAGEIGVDVENVACPADITEEELIKTIRTVNDIDAIHGLMVLTPLPDGMDQEKIMWTISPEKDVDGSSRMSMAGAYMDRDFGYPPCTAEACIDMMDYYGIDMQGKNVVIIGRSLVAGKPIAMMMLKRNATVTICHSRTRDIEEIAKNADILVAAIGRPKVIGSEYVTEGQTIIDVGINLDGEGQLCGDVAAEEVIEAAGAITPVPGGVGTVTASMLIKHVVDAAEKRTA